MGYEVGCNHERSKERLVDGKEGLAYRMDRNQMSVDRPWIFLFFIFIIFDGELVLVNLDVLGLSTTHACKSIKKISPIKTKKLTKPILR